MTAHKLIRSIIKDLKDLEFKSPVSHVYNPLEYAQDAYEAYVALYGIPPKEIILLGMNPGPWGMAQTGVPFGEIDAVKDWLGIDATVTAPSRVHPKRPILGFDCRRSEVSGRRLWGWVKSTFKTPDNFFSRFFVANYCPLMFIDADGRNRTPDKVPMAQKTPLLKACDRSLRHLVRWMGPRYVVGVGRFAETRAHHALKDFDVIIGGITHPSPANPKANRGWEALIEQELKGLGIRF
jgi:single-strand selective monofunctional uracil DNA glycosylase